LHKPSRDGGPYTKPFRQNPEDRFVLLIRPQIQRTTELAKKKGVEGRGFETQLVAWALSSLLYVKLVDSSLTRWLLCLQSCFLSHIAHYRYQCSLFHHTCVSAHRSALRTFLFFR
jgi:hypothetical protein